MCCQSHLSVAVKQWKKDKKQKSTPLTEESEESADEPLGEQNSSQSEEENILPETLPVNSDDKEETAMLDETQKVLGEIGELIKRIIGSQAR